MDKSHLHLKPNYYDTYINKVPNVTITTALEDYGAFIYKKELLNLLELGDMVYAADKWSIKQIIQHLIDTERIFQYRALRFARRDQSELPGFDENLYAQSAHVSHRTLDDLLDEYDHLRKSVSHMFKSFTSEDLLATGTCFNCELSVLAIGYILAGHALHHMEVIEERYFAMLPEMENNV